MKKILLIDDSKETHLLLKEAFEGTYQLISSFDLKQGSQILRKEKVDLILLDVALPDGNGFEYCANLSANPETKNVPIVFLTGKTDLSAKTIGFSLGAEDYIVKPFDPLEVKLRCSAKLKKHEVKADHSALFEIGDMRFEILSQRVFLKLVNDEKQLDLTPTGFKLLLYLARNESRVFTRDQLISSVWGEGTYIVDRTVDTHIGLLRKQIMGSCVSIQSVHGQGYRLLKSNFEKKSAA